MMPQDSDPHIRLRCPHCGAEDEGPRSRLIYRPFCSERCKLVDLSRWLGEDYRIGRPAVEGELPEGLEERPLES